jgi:hypothetical protein
MRPREDAEQEGKQIDLRDDAESNGGFKAQKYFGVPISVVAQGAGWLFNEATITSEATR